MPGFTTLLSSDESIDESDIANIMLTYGSVTAAMLTLYQHVTGAQGWNASLELNAFLPLASCWKWF